MDHRSATYTTATLAAASGCEAGTFHKWRARNDLFPSTKGQTGWNRWTALDICVVRAIVVLVEHGLPADDAVWIVAGEQIGAIAHDFEKILEGQEPLSKFIAVVRGDASAPGEKTYDAIKREVVLASERPARLTVKRLGKGQLTVSKIMQFGPGAATILDLQSIVRHVSSALSKVGDVR